MKLITVKEAARLLSLSEKTLYQWRWRRESFPFVKVGRALRVSYYDLMEFIEEKKLDFKKNERA